MAVVVHLAEKKFFFIFDFFNFNKQQIKYKSKVTKQRKTTHAQKKQNKKQTKKITYIEKQTKH